jgi:hypothetical protein
MQAYRVMKVWSAEKGTRWCLRRQDNLATIHPFSSGEAAYEYAIENEIPVYEDWD